VTLFAFFDWENALFAAGCAQRLRMSWSSTWAPSSTGCWTRAVDVCGAVSRGCQDSLKANHGGAPPLLPAGHPAGFRTS